MKKIIIPFTLFSFCFVFSQNKDLINDYSNKKIKIEKKISVLQDSIKFINEQIDKLNRDKIINENKNITTKTTIKENAKIRETNSPLANIIFTAKKEENVLVLDYDSDYFKVCLDNICGYVNSLWIKKNEDMEKMIIVKNAILENIRIKAQKEEEKRSIAEKQKLIKKYGQNTYNELMSGKIWLGMTDSMAVISVGNPKEVNRTVGSWGVHEQWVYTNFYLYFENGKLTSYQD